MLSLDEIRSMLLRFEEANNNGELEDEGEGALKALQWVTEDADYSEMDGMLPDEEVCPDCSDSECPGAAGGECTDPIHGFEPADPEELQIDLKPGEEKK
jgi:hypothetical protein